MIVPLFRHATNTIEPHEVPDELVQDFVEYLLATRAWREAHPAVIHERAVRFRKAALERAVYVEPLLEPATEAEAEREARLTAEDRAHARRRRHGRFASNER